VAHFDTDNIGGSHPMVLEALCVLCGAGAECCITIAEENSTVDTTATTPLDLTSIELGAESVKAIQLLWDIADTSTSSSVSCAVYSAMYHYSGPIAALDSEICPISAQNFKARYVLFIANAVYILTVLV
jgi:hypothetical protein